LCPTADEKSVQPRRTTAALALGLLPALLAGPGCTRPNPRFREPPSDAGGQRPGVDAHEAGDPADRFESGDGYWAGPDLGAPDHVSPDGAPDLIPEPDVPAPPPDAPPDLAGDAAAGLTVGLALYWPFDEASGTVALDATGNAWHGTYIGSTGIPAPSSNVASAIRFPNPYSRSFTGSNGHAVRLVSSPPSIRPANNLTVSVWYRATTTDSSGDSVGSELVNMGDNYVLRIRPGQIEFSKHTGESRPFIQCLASLPNHLDGAWHHIAGVTTPSGLHLYFDGVQRCTADGADIHYGSSSDLLVGRHATRGVHNIFSGNIDEVRIYNRGLSAAEITWLAQGGR
jgi:hypothetical protein